MLHARVWPGPSTVMVTVWRRSSILSCSMNRRRASVVGRRSDVFLRLGRLGSIEVNVGCRSVRVTAVLGGGRFGEDRVQLPLGIVQYCTSLLDLICSTESPDLSCSTDELGNAAAKLAPLPIGVICWKRRSRQCRAPRWHLRASRPCGSCPSRSWGSRRQYGGGPAP